MTTYFQVSMIELFVAHTVCQSALFYSHWHLCASIHKKSMKKYKVVSIGVLLAFINAFSFSGQCSHHRIKKHPP